MTLLERSESPDRGGAGGEEFWLGALASLGGTTALNVWPAVPPIDVTDRDDRSVVVDAPDTNSVLCFGAGAMAPRVRVREDKDDVMRIWQDLGLPTAPVE